VRAGEAQEDEEEAQVDEEVEEAEEELEEVQADPGRKKRVLRNSFDNISFEKLCP
jgi:predicted neutral ceramidase superfamily lipid hydrolase